MNWGVLGNAEMRAEEMNWRKFIPNNLEMSYGKYAIQSICGRQSLKLYYKMAHNRGALQSGYRRWRVGGLRRSDQGRGTGCPF